MLNHLFTENNSSSISTEESFRTLTESSKSGEIISFSRKKFFSVILLDGSYEINFEDTSLPLEGKNILFTTTKVPFGIHCLKENKPVQSCAFSEGFITKANSGYDLLSFSVYKPGSQFIYTLDEIEYDKFSTIFKKIAEEDLNEANPLQTSLLRHYTMELILNGQKLQASASYVNRRNTAEVVACSFIRLLENQFPIDDLSKTIDIKTPGEFAEALHLHPVYLNRQVKKAKGRTMSDFIASRVLQEAKILLRTTTWNISEIASALAFEEASHFNTFFRKHTEVTPSEYRNSKV